MRTSPAVNIAWQLTRRDILGRYRGSVLGIGWSFLHPLLMLAVYTFVFSSIFKTRWPGLQGDSNLLFAANLFSGLIVFNFVAESSVRASTLIVANANYVKRVIFPLEILGVVTVASAGFHALISVLIVFLFKLISTGSLSIAILSLPFLWTPMALFVLSIVWIISVCGVYIRDTTLVINVFTNILLFLSPIFFPSSAYPHDWKPLMQLNPMMWLIEQTRAVIIHGRWPDMRGIILSFAVSLLALFLSYQIFRKARRGFADVL